jgi:monovalent cation:H+ antiporter, CPA1 family
LSSFLLYTPLTTLFDDLVAPVVNLPLSSSIFLVVFMPILLFHAALTIDLREIAEDTAPILTLTESGSEAATSSARWPY